MNGDTLTAVAAIVGIVTITVAGLFAIGGESMSSIQRQCEQRGYIQNSETRILCSVEKGVKP